MPIAASADECCSVSLDVAGLSPVIVYWHRWRKNTFTTDRHDALQFAIVDLSMLHFMCSMCRPMHWQRQKSIWSRAIKVSRRWWSLPKHHIDGSILQKLACRTRRVYRLYSCTLAHRSTCLLHDSSGPKHEEKK